MGGADHIERIDAWREPHWAEKYPVEWIACRSSSVLALAQTFIKSIEDVHLSRICQRPGSFWRIFFLGLCLIADKFIVAWVRDTGYNIHRL